MQKAFPDLFEAQPDLLFQLVTMLNPEVVQDSGVPVCTTVQEPGHFVITFPRSYHGGFNHGFNCAEAVNFAPSDWLPMGGWAVERYRFYHKAAVLSHDELLCIVAKVCTSQPPCSVEMALFHS
jgi:histone demethylase JARID1